MVTYANLTFQEVKTSASGRGAIFMPTFDHSNDLAFIGPQRRPAPIPLAIRLFSEKAMPSGDRCNRKHGNEDYGY